VPNRISHLRLTNI